MSASASFMPEPVLPDADAAEARRRVLLDRQLERIDRLVEAGMELVEALLAQAKGEGPQVVEGDIALAYGRVSRAVRMAILLQSRLAEATGPQAAGKQEVVFTWEEPQDSRAERTAARKERVEHVVEQVARREHDDVETVDRLVSEAAERLERDDIYGDVLSRPVDELVADICRDLGLEPDWPALALRPWARREIASGEAGRRLTVFANGPAAGAAATAGLGAPRRLDQRAACPSGPASFEPPG